MHSFENSKLIVLLKGFEVDKEWKVLHIVRELGSKKSQSLKMPKHSQRRPFRLMRFLKTKKRGEALCVIGEKLQGCKKSTVSFVILNRIVKNDKDL